MILLDSSGWIEIFLDGKLARKFEKYLTQKLIISTINLFEVYRKIAKSSEELALQAIASMRQASIASVSEQISLEAADLSIKYHLGMADSLILATAGVHGATLITKDHDFFNLPNCKVIS